MKRLLWWVVIAAITVAAARLLKERLVPVPEGPVGEPPRFRVAPVEPHPEPAAADDLTALKGVGPVYADRLAGAGITTFSELAGRQPASLAAAIGVREDLAADWIAQAAERSKG